MRSIRPHPLVRAANPPPFAYPPVHPLFAPVCSSACLPSVRPRSLVRLFGPLNSFTCPLVCFSAHVRSATRPPVYPFVCPSCLPPSASFHPWSFAYKLWRVEVDHALFVIACFKTVASSWRIYCMRSITQEGTQHWYMGMVLFWSTTWSFAQWGVQAEHAFFVIACLKIVASPWRIYCMRPIA